jgi:hypothetical protein
MIASVSRFGDARNVLSTFDSARSPDDATERHRTDLA